MLFFDRLEEWLTQSLRLHSVACHSSWQLGEQLLRVLLYADDLMLPASTPQLLQSRNDKKPEAAPSDAHAPATGSALTHCTTSQRAGCLMGIRFGAVSKACTSLTHVTREVGGFWGNPCDCVTPCTAGVSRCTLVGTGTCAPRGGTLCSSAFVDIIGSVKVCCNAQG